MTEPHWIIRVHGREYHVSDNDYRQMRARLERLRPPMQLVEELSGEDVRFPIDWRSSVEFSRVG